MAAYEENLYYAKRGDPLAQDTIMTFCGFAAQHRSSNYNDDYPADMSIAHYWADSLKASAAAGNTLAQYTISKVRSEHDDVLERWLTRETKTEFLALQGKYKRIIEEKLANNDPYAMYAVSKDNEDLELLKKSADLGCSLACDALSDYYVLGGFYSCHDFSKAQPSKQFYYAQKGALLNDFYACRCQMKLASCYEFGDGVERDKSKFSQWLNTAAENGCYEAIKKLEATKAHEQTNSASSTHISSQTGSKSSGGCYVATCVYGSYDCPQVWTLRRYRDYKLMRSAPGTLFVKLYYKVSPKLVKAFGNKRWFTSVFKNVLDKFVVKLKNKGYSDAKYNDQ